MHDDKTMMLQKIKFHTDPNSYLNNRKTDFNKTLKTPHKKDLECRKREFIVI